MGELGFNLLASLARLFLEAIPKMSTINFWRENSNYFKNFPVARFARIFR